MNREKDNGWITREGWGDETAHMKDLGQIVLFCGGCFVAGLLINILTGCASAPTVVIPPTAHADCVLADELQKKETVTPLPEDHDLSLSETWEQLRSHLVEAKGIADRSNDKTDFVNQHCRDHSDGIAP